MLSWAQRSIASGNRHIFGTVIPHYYSIVAVGKAKSIRNEIDGTIVDETMTFTLDEKINELVRKMPELIEDFDYRKGPDLYFYKKTMALRKRSCLRELLDEPDRYLELIYATLAAWDMNSRGAKMKYFDDFKSSIVQNRDRFLQLSSHKLEALSNGAFEQAKMLCGEIYDNMHLMISEGRLVSNSKVMHFILPELVMPMDRQNTLKFFFGSTNESKQNFLKILTCSYKIAKRIDLSKFIDDEWHQSIPKIIDNAIISHESPKYRRQR
jgi:hypothetical protein